MTDIIVVGIVAVLMVFIIRNRVKARKSGGGCGCRCSGCSSAGCCSGERKQ